MRRSFIIAGGLCAAALALYSCSMDAALSTDGTGRVVSVSALRVASSFPRVAVAMMIVGGHVAFELRWTQSAARAVGFAATTSTTE